MLLANLNIQHRMELNAIRSPSILTAVIIEESYSSNSHLYRHVEACEVKFGLESLSELFSRMVDSTGLR